MLAVNLVVKVIPMCGIWPRGEIDSLGSRIWRIRVGNFKNIDHHSKGKRGKGSRMLERRHNPFCPSFYRKSILIQIKVLEDPLHKLMMADFIRNIVRQQ